MTLKNRFKFIIKIFISIVIVAVILYLINFKDLESAFSKISIGDIAIGIFLSHLGWVISAYKFNLLFTAPFPSMLRLQYLTILYSFVLPGQLAGEGYKLVKLSKTSGYAKAGSVVIIDRVTGFFGILVFATIGMVTTETGIPMGLKVLFFLALIGFVLPFVLMEKVQRVLIKYKSQFQGKVYFVLTSLLSFVENWLILQKKSRILLYNIVLGMLFQFINIYINFSIAQSIGIQVSIFDWFWIFGLISLALFLPITYAGLGIREGSMVGLLGLFSVEAEKALLLSFLILGFQLTLVLVGLILNLTKEKDYENLYVDIGQ